MTELNLTQESYVDYVASLYFHACGVEGVTFTAKTVKVGDEDVALIHVEGVQPSTGLLVNLDLWPRDRATKEDLKGLPSHPEDLVFRVGYHPSVDAEGHTSLRAGRPKWVSYYKGKHRVTLSGGKREFPSE